MSTPIDHWCTDDIICPHCGYKAEDGGDWPWTNNDTCEGVECGECGKVFSVERYFSVSYTTTKAKDIK